MRKLVTIQRVIELSPIAGADRIVEAKVMGWRTIVKKDEFVVGDYCLFFEVDSILPEAPWSEFMRSKKFRIKTMKMRGVLSQGLALPLRIFSGDLQSKIDLSEGFDCTGILGITQYEPIIVDYVGGFVDQAGPFPAHVPRTDEDRIQSNLQLLEYITSQPYAITIKIDGSSLTATYDRDENFLVCSRNFVLKNEPDRLSRHGAVTNKYQLSEKLRGTSLAVQGELVGPGVQTNCLRVIEHELLIFNVFDWKERRYFNHHEIVAFCKSMDLKSVPTEETGDCFSYDLETLLEKARGFYPGTQNDREGLVIRSLGKQRVSFKVLNNDFLLKEA